MLNRFFVRYFVITLLVAFLSLPAFSQGWRAQTSGTTANLNSVAFVDSLNGWVVGSSGTILHTTDGGSGWIAQTSGTNSTLNSVKFVNANYGWVVGYDSSIFRTTNGGTTWLRQHNTSYLANLTSVDFVDTNYGWAVERSCDIYRTTNGGRIWSFWGSDFDLLNSIAFIDTTDGWIAYGGVIKHTNAIVNNELQNVLWQSQYYNGAITIYNLNFVNATRGWAVGSNGTIVHLHVGDTTWSTQMSGTTNTLYSVSFADTNNGWTVGNTGTILHTTNSGTTWNTQITGTTGNLKSVSFVNATTGWAVGEGGLILHTTNGGITHIVTVTAPNGGELWGIGITDTIRWTTQNITGDVRIELNRTFPTGAWDSIAVVPATTNNYPWLVTNPPSTTARFRITSIDYPSASDTSNANFRIVIPYVTVFRPNGGEEYSIGGRYTIFWSLLALTGNMAIEINRNYPNGSWENITTVSSTGNQYCPWNITGPATDHARIRIRTLQMAIVVGDTSDGDFQIIDETAIATHLSGAPTTFSIAYAYPNPFNSTITLRYELPKSSAVSFDIFNATGQRIAFTSLVTQSAGSHDWQWNAQRFPSGIYYVQMNAGNGNLMRQRVVLVK